MQPEPLPPFIDSVSEPSKTGFRRIVRYLLAGNPFFVLSAVLLLYAMRRLSFDPRLFSTEVSQLIFNFGSFQCYELLLAATAIWLASRRIWYDSTLLVFIENMFAFVPLLLVSQALLVENSIAAFLCAAGAILFAIRAGTMTRMIRPLNFPPHLLVTGALLLVINVAAPVLTRHLHKSLSVPAWDHVGTRLANVEWFLVAPALILILLAFRRKSKESPAYFSRPEFPLLTAMIWIAGTAVHFYCVDYVYGLPPGILRLSLTIPTVWTACWVLWLRADDIKWASAKSGPIYEKLLLATSVAALVMPAMSNDRAMLLALGTINVVLFSILAFKTKDWFMVLLLAGSAGLTLSTIRFGTAMPVDSNGELSFGKTLFVAICVFLLLRSTFSRDPRYAVLGGFTASILAGIFIPAVWEFFPLTQIALVYAVLHSVRWDESLDRHAKLARLFFSALWLANSAAWLSDDGQQAYWGVFLPAIAVFVTALAARWISGFWAHKVLPFAALLTMALPPGFKISQTMEQTPVGLLVLLASFVLFAVGIMTALLRSRWLAKAAGGRIVHNL